MISQKSIQEVLDTARVEEVVEDFVTLKRRGSNMIGLCPFHAEKTPSFSVSPSKNIFKCFGCGKGGGPVQFVMEHEQLSFPEAIRYLAKKYQITLEEDEQSEEMSADLARKERLFLLNDAALKFFRDQLMLTDLGRNVGISYLSGRGFSRPTMEKFGLGYAPPGGTALLGHLKSLGYDEEEMKSLGLLSKNGTDFFRDRVMFALHNISGKVVGFAGRSLKTDKAIPKYMNSPESEIYHKSHFLYGAFFAKGAIRKEDECILVEGYTDVISLHEAGIENVVASSGTALTEDQIRIIKRYTEQILILYDGDPAGIKAAMRGIDLILEQNMNVRIVLLPEGEDPDSYVQKHGKDGILEFFASHAKDFILFKADLLNKETGGDPIRKAGVIRDIVGSIARVPDQIKRSLFIQECARIMDISEPVLVGETNKQIRSLIKTGKFKTRQVPREELPEEEPVTRPSSSETQYTPYGSDEYQERDLLRILLMHGNKWHDEETGIRIADFLLEHITPLLDVFDQPTYSRIFRHIIESRVPGEELRIPDLVNSQDAEIAQITGTLLSSRYEYSDNWEDKWRIFLLQKRPEQNEKADVEQGWLRFQLRKLNRMLEKQRDKIKSLDMADTEELTVQLNVYKRMLEHRNQIASSLKMTLW